MPTFQRLPIAAFASLEAELARAVLWKVSARRMQAFSRVKSHRDIA